MVETIGWEGERNQALCHDEGCWRVEFDGDRFLVTEARGLAYLAILLANPGRRIPAVELVRATQPDDPGQATPALRRVWALREGLEQAMEDNDLGRAEVMRSALDGATTFALDEAGMAPGRTIALERARKRVSNALRRALKNLAEHNRHLGEHLEVTLRTGQYCAYLPDPRSGVRWTIGKETDETEALPAAAELRSSSAL